MLESTEKGGVRNSIHNCLTVFQYDPVLSGAIAKNLLTERTDIIKPIGIPPLPAPSHDRHGYELYAGCIWKKLTD